MAAKFKIDRVRYHRNGSHCEGFYAVEFRERDDHNGRKWVRRIGMLFGNPVDEPDTTIAQCAVIAPDDLLNTRSGDYYEPELRAAAIAAHHDNSAYAR